MHICQPPLNTVVVEAEAFVVEAKEVQDGGVEVVDGGEVFYRFIAEVVGGAVGEGGLHAGAG